MNEAQSRANGVETPEAPADRNASFRSSLEMASEESRRLTDSIVAALKTVYDPEIPADIYELGLIYNVDVDEDRFCQYRNDADGSGLSGRRRNADMGRERGQRGPWRCRH